MEYTFKYFYNTLFLFCLLGIIFIIQNTPHETQIIIYNLYLIKIQIKKCQLLKIIFKDTDSKNYKILITLYFTIKYDFHLTY